MTDLAALALAVLTLAGAYLVGRRHGARLGNGWETVRDTGIHLYERHSRSGARRVRTNVAGRGHQPIDQVWLDTGMWTADAIAAGLIAPPKPPRGGSSVKKPRP